MFTSDQPLVMFLALFALYSPLAALSSYLPIVGPFDARDQTRLALGLFFNVSVFVLAALWIGEPLLELLGITTAALSITGGIALLYEGVPMMRGIEEAGHEPAHTPTDDLGTETTGGPEVAAWRSIVFTPLTFPLTVGGTTFGLLVAFASTTHNVKNGLALTAAGLAYAAVTGITLYAAGHVHRRVSPKARMVLGRIAGILLTAIAVSLLANGTTRLVVDTLHSLKS